MKPAIELQRGTILQSSSLADKPHAAPDVDAVRRSLANAWGTELLLALSGAYASEDEFVRLTNNWGAVQAYYVGYHSFQAYLLANGERRPTTHSKTQKMFADRWTQRHLQMPPWTFAAAEGRFYNGPPGRDVDLDVHQWTSCTADNSWDVAGRALKSTREDSFPQAERSRREKKRSEARREWEREESIRLAHGRRPRKTAIFRLPHLTVAEKTDVHRRVRPHTTLDYLYRLRIKSNYEDSTMFTEGPQDAVSSTRVHRDLVWLASSVLLMHELHICGLVGLDPMTDMVDSWIGGNMPADYAGGIALRRAAILGS